MKRAVSLTFLGVWCLALAFAQPTTAQQITQRTGSAFAVDLVQTANELSMRDGYARALYLHIRANPSTLDNTEFYVNFLIYLMHNAPEFSCSSAFANEFERRDYFTQAFGLKEPLRNAVNSAVISERFDVAFSIDTGRYDFTSGNLPFQSVRAVGLREGLSSRISAPGGVQNCAGQILNETEIGTELFPWRFSVVNEAVEEEQPRFPFGNSLTLSTADARALFEQFGRQLFAIVGYRFQAANDGSRKIQIVPTDGQLFGLSSDAVVRVKTFAHATLSQPQSLDMTNPLRLEVPEYGIDMDMQFQQQGFRAVGTGTRKDAGTEITAASEFPVNGSAAVSSSAFVMRLATPQLNVKVSGLRSIPNAERYLTLFGALEVEKATATQAPVSGTAFLLQLNPETGELETARPVGFRGAFRPAEASASAETESTGSD